MTSRDFPATSIAIVIAAAALMIVGCHHSVDSDLDKGNAALQANNPGDAERDFQDAAKTAPNDPRVHVALGNLYGSEQKSDQAQIEFMKAIDLDRGNAESHVALGNLYLGQQKLLLAEEQYRAAVALAPANVTYRIHLGDVLRQQNRAVESESELRTSIGLDPESAQAHMAMARLLQGLPNRGPEAEAEMASARALDPKLGGEGAPATSIAPASAPAGAATAATVASAETIKPLNKMWKLTKDSPVYQSPDATSSVVAQVKHRKYVHVVGFTHDYLQIQLRNGTVGFIPSTAAE